MTVNLEREAQATNIAQVGNVVTGIEHPHGSVTVLDVGLPLDAGIPDSSTIYSASSENDLHASTAALETALVSGGVEAKDAHERVSALVKLGSGDANERESFANELNELTKRAQANSLTPEETDWLAVIREVMNDPGVKKAFSQSAGVFSGGLGSELGLLVLDRKYLKISALMQTPTLKEKQSVKKLYGSRSVALTRLTLGLTAAGSVLAACGGIAPVIQAPKEVTPAVQIGLTIDSVNRATDGWKGMKLISGRIVLGDQVAPLVENDGKTIVSAIPFTDKGPDNSTEYSLGLTTLTVDGKDTYALPVMYQYDKASNTTRAFGLFLEMTGVPAKQSETSRTFKIVEFKDGKLVETGRKLVANVQSGRGLLGISDDKTNTFYYLVDARSNKPATSAPTPPPKMLDASTTAVGGVLWGNKDAAVSATTVLLSLLELPTATPVQPTPDQKPTTAPATAAPTEVSKPESLMSELNNVVLRALERFGIKSFDIKKPTNPVNAADLAKWKELENRVQTTLGPSNVGPHSLGVRYGVNNIVINRGTILNFEEIKTKNALSQVIVVAYIDNRDPDNPGLRVVPITVGIINASQQDSGVFISRYADAANLTKRLTSSEFKKAMEQFLRDGAMKPISIAVVLRYGDDVKKSLTIEGVPNYPQRQILFDAFPDYPDKPNTVKYPSITPGNILADFALRNLSPNGVMGSVIGGINLNEQTGSLELADYPTLLSKYEK